MFLSDCWYVAGWLHELAENQLMARQILGNPLVFYRTTSGEVVAMADRCPHRHAPLSLGRVEGDNIRCMYHGLIFNPSGHCLAVPGSDVIPVNSGVKTYPTKVKDNWIWVWMGDVKRGDKTLIPDAFGLDNPALVMRSSQIDYAANYMLINDNLCDLSHVDFVHETTLSLATGGGWSAEIPRVRAKERGIRAERWFIAKPASPSSAELVDTWSTYDYLVPGVFVMENKSFPHGYAEKCGFNEPTDKPMTYRVEQQAVTPVSETETRYFFASGIEAKFPARLIDGFFDVVMEAFGEDRRMIEAQQRVWEKTPPDHKMAFILHDKGPSMFRKILSRLMKEELDRSRRQDF